MALRECEEKCEARQEAALREERERSKAAIQAALEEERGKMDSLLEDVKVRGVSVLLHM